MKICTKCKIEKPLSEFCRHSGKPDGLHYSCRGCNKAAIDLYRSRPENKKKITSTTKAWRLKNREKLKQKESVRYQENKELSYTKHVEWRRRNPDRAREYRRAYGARNPSAVLANVKARTAFKLNATPQWLTLDHRRQMREIYKTAARLTAETGIKHHVDHIIPLKGVGVCGLHVPWNLQVLTAEENMKKHNAVIQELALAA